mmetsp:Transcript_17337/g.30292  ORF Transcript_17337/g.30292 Transcript_17337/m.30292 type:complete len:144 (-) Transcript_17337:498-929(-)
MAGSSQEVIVVPRNFVLLEELEKVEKGLTDMNVSYGLARDDDVSMSHWLCTILGPPNTAIENRIISIRILCGPQYPQVMPEVQFVSKLNFPFIDANGRAKNLPISWNRNMKIETLLVHLRALMAKAEYKKFKQPPAKETYPGY